MRKTLGRLKSCFRHDRSPAKDATIDTTSKTRSTTQPIEKVVRDSPGQRIFDAARQLLEEEDRITIDEIVPQKDVDGIRSAQDAVLAKRKEFEDNKWTTTVNGRTIDLSTVATTLSELLGKIQPGIDLVSQAVKIAANVDPLYIGIPVALISALLGVVKFSYSVMERLLAGVIRATSMLTQLTVYFEYFKQVEESNEAKRLEDALIDSYRLVSVILATGYRALLKQGLRRNFELLWSKEKIGEYEKECDAAGSRLERAAESCAIKDVGGQLRQIKKQISGFIDGMQSLLDMKAIVEAIDIKVSLQRLRSASDASYDAIEQKKDKWLYGYCLQGTRETLIEKIHSWCQQPSQSSQRIFWVRGMAGTGKSTLLRTIARKLATEGSLAASFFFRHDITEQRDGRLFVATIVNQLITTYTELRPYVAAALDSEPVLPDGSITSQFKNLLHGTMSNAMPRTKTENLVMVIDALDECQSGHANAILKELGQLAKDTGIKIIITSRPENHLLQELKTLKPESLRLEDIKEEESESDIGLFLTACFEKLRADDAGQQYPQLSTDWPRKETMEDLIQLTKPLFIYAATIFRYIENDNKPDVCLADILRNSRQDALDGMQMVYLPILDRIHDKPGKAEAIKDFKTIVGSIILLEDPLTIPALGDLLGWKGGTIEKLLTSLGSVLRVPNDSKVPVQILHKSFKDFLLDSDHRFRVDARATHSDLLKHSLRLMNEQLSRDLCNVVSPDTGRTSIDVNIHITSQLQYSCLHWVSHVKEEIQDNDLVHGFLQGHFLHWLEALSWLGRISSSVEFITQLQSHLKVNKSAQLTAFLDDALKFVRTSSYVAHLAPLQLYCSALIFTPTKSIVREIFRHETMLVFRLRPIIPSRWSSEILRLEGHEDRVTAVAFSREGDLLASASGDKTVRVWDPKNGDEKLKLEGHEDRVTAVAFSRQGDLLASASHDMTVRVWDPKNGDEKLKLEGHEDRVTAVAFSRQGDLLASASGDKTVRVWDLIQKKEKYRLEGLGDIVTEVSFRQNDTLLRTNYGEFRLPQSCTSDTVTLISSSGLQLDGQWLKYDSKNILWLPLEYRGFCSAVYEDTLVIGQASGAVSFFRR